MSANLPPMPFGTSEDLEVGHIFRPTHAAGWMP